MQFSKIQLFLAQKKNQQKMLSFCIVLGALVLKQNFDFTLMGTLILIYFGLALLWRISSRVSAFFALVFLASCPLLLILDKEGLAEIAAVQAYYLLVVTVVLQIVELNSKKQEEISYDWAGLRAKIRNKWGKIAARLEARERESVSREKVGQKEKYKKYEKGGMKDASRRSGRLGVKIGKLMRKISEYVHTQKKTAQQEKKNSIRKEVGGKMSRKKKIAYILIVSFLVFEVAVVFFDQSLLVSALCYLFVVALFFPKRVWKLFFAANIMLALFSIFALAFLSEKQASTVYSWLLYSCGLTIWTLSVRAWRGK